MNHHEISLLSVELIMRYYNNDPMPFLRAMDDDALWYGPAKGQIIKGREAMLRVWKADTHKLTFTVGTMREESITSHHSFCDVMLAYPLVTHYPGGQDISVFQRLLLSWGERIEKDEHGNKIKVPRILLCSISHPHDKHEDDLVYLKHFDQVYAGNRFMPQKGEHIHFHGADRSDYFFMSDNIVWIEAGKGGKHSFIHTADSSSGGIEVTATVAQLAEEYPHLFLRCHQSYLINPHYIRNISRFQVAMTDGSVHPIPEKKYTAFRDKAVKWHE